MRREALKAALAAREVQHLPAAQRESLLLNWWSLDPEDAEWASLPPELQEELRTSDEPGDAANPRYDPLLVVGLVHGYRGVTGEYLLGRARELGLQVDAVEGEPEPLLTCPCCRYRTLPERGGYFVCQVCLWEDDGGSNPEAFSSPNRMTLRKGRENFERYGWCLPREVEQDMAALRHAYPREAAS
jgi:hypothetical protein